MLVHQLVIGFGPISWLLENLQKWDHWLDQDVHITAKAVSSQGNHIMFLFLLISQESKQDINQLLFHSQTHTHIVIQPGQLHRGIH